MAWGSLKEVWHEDLVLLFPSRGEDVCTLNGLREIPEHIINHQNGFFGGGGTGDVYFLSLAVWLNWRGFGMGGREAER